MYDLILLTFLSLVTATSMSGTCHLLHRLWNRANHNRSR